ncbi:hypothetical protein EXN66_Car016672 [Channa argus]|uniref:Uncharacterized protein n=1 Tax=Channa argus TaxID=215402 RepID=A0A6G1QEX9_CHAAH|nr:hypothetical protein EXN66_Car016672 [Channa argus]
MQEELFDTVAVRTQPWPIYNVGILHVLQLKGEKKKKPFVFIGFISTNLLHVP